jgi:hypothetical protein
VTLFPASRDRFSYPNFITYGWKVFAMKSGDALRISGTIPSGEGDFSLLRFKIANFISFIVVGFPLIFGAAFGVAGSRRS